MAPRASWQASSIETRFFKSNHYPCISVYLSPTGTSSLRHGFEPPLGFTASGEKRDGGGLPASAVTWPEE